MVVCFLVRNISVDLFKDLLAADYFQVVNSLLVFPSSDSISYLFSFVTQWLCILNSSRSLFFQPCLIAMPSLRSDPHLADGLLKAQLGAALGCGHQV